MSDKKKIKYKQCGLRKWLGEKGSHKISMAWIPEKFAVKGKFIKIGKPVEEAEDGWEVTSVGETTRLATEIDNKGQRDRLKSIQ